MPKRVYSWGLVKAGDVISFRYEGKVKGSKAGLDVNMAKVSGLTTVLVLNPKLPYTRKDKTSTLHLVGLKLECRGSTPTIASKPKLVTLLEEIGEIDIIESKGIDTLFNVIIKPADLAGKRGVKKSVYKRIKALIQNYSVYRTYDYVKASKSSVFLEPVVLPKELVEFLTKEPESTSEAKQIVEKVKQYSEVAKEE